MARDAKYGVVLVEKQPGNPLGDDEPVFLIRGRDWSAPQAIRAYADCAEECGATAEHAQAARLVADEFVRWQQNNPALVKVPDSQ